MFPLASAMPFSTDAALAAAITASVDLNLFVFPAATSFATSTQTTTATATSTTTTPASSTATSTSTSTSTSLPRPFHPAPAWTSHPGFIVGLTVLFALTFALYTALALWIRRRRDARYAARNAPKFATSVSFGKSFPGIAAWAHEWLHSPSDDVVIRRVRRADVELQSLSTGRMPTSLALGHARSASAPDLRVLAARAATTGPNGVLPAVREEDESARSVGLSPFPRSEEDGADERMEELGEYTLPTVTHAEIAEARGCVSMPTSIRGESPEPAEQPLGVLERRMTTLGEEAPFLEEFPVVRRGVTGDWADGVGEGGGWGGGSDRGEGKAQI